MTVLMVSIFFLVEDAEVQGCDGEKPDDEKEKGRDVMHSTRKEHGKGGESS